FGQFGLGLIETAGVAVQRTKSVLHIGVVRESLGQILVRFDGLFIVFHHASVIGLDEIALGRRQALAELQRLAGGLFGVGVVAERRVGLRQTRVRQSKLRVSLDGILQGLDGLQVLAVAQ